MGSKSQRKGRADKLELARLLQGYGCDVQPSMVVSYGAAPNLVGLPHIHIECKHNERLNIPEAVAQAIRDAEWFQDGVSTVFHRRNRFGWLVTQRLGDRIALCRKKEPPASHADSDANGQQKGYLYCTSIYKKIKE